MEKETLEKANRLFKLISESREKSEKLNKQIFAIENKYSGEFGKFSTTKRIIEHYTKEGWSAKTEKIEIESLIIDDEIIVKMLKHKKYIEDNLIRKYELEFSKL